MLHQPTNYEVTFAYVKVATDRGDYEAAIAALERLLYYNPNLAHVKYELGTLYFKLRSFDMAKRYFKEALVTPGLDPVTRSRIEGYLPDTERQTQQSRFAGFAQTGVRYQSNANFAPSNGLVNVGGQQLGLPTTNTKRSDSNWFGLVGLSHDYDLNDAAGSTFETRFTGYLTQQFALHDLDVGLVDGSFGWRIPIMSNLFPGASVKPYVTGGNIWVGGSQYLVVRRRRRRFALPVNDAPELRARLRMAACECHRQHANGESGRQPGAAERVQHRRLVHGRHVGEVRVRRDREARCARLLPARRSSGGLPEFRSMGRRSRAVVPGAAAVPVDAALLDNVAVRPLHRDRLRRGRTRSSIRPRSGLTRHGPPA